MKKKLIIFFVVLLIIGFVVDFFSNFSIYIKAGRLQPITYVTLKWGNSYNEVGLEGPYEDFWYEGPATFDVDKEGNVYIVDQLHNRIIEVDKNSNIIDSIDISKIISENDLDARYGPIKLIIGNKCLFLLHFYSYTLPPVDPYSPPGGYGSRYVSVITKDKIVKIDIQKLLGNPVDVYMDRLNDNSIVLTPSIPPEDKANWEGPKAVIVNRNGEVRIVNNLVNGSFDGITPFASLIYDEDKETHFYRNVKIQVKDPKTDKNIFASGLIQNGELIDIFGLQFNGNKSALMYQTESSYNKENDTITTHIVIFTLSPKEEEHYIMVVGKDERKDMLPPPFSYRSDFVLGQDGFFYTMVYKKDELHIQKFVPEETQTEYYYRSLKF